MWRVPPSSGDMPNFPGYDINGEYTTVYERPDYPLRPLKELTYNQIYYNHVWPHIALLFDFLISDVAVRSEAKSLSRRDMRKVMRICRARFMAIGTGVFYGHQGVQLWMPAKLLRIDNPQVNYVAGYDDNSLYLALSNQCPRPVTATIRINPDLAPYSLRQDYNVRTWQADREGPPRTLHDGEFTISIPASGLTAIAMDGIRIVPQFQSGVLASGPGTLGQKLRRKRDRPWQSHRDVAVFRSSEHQRLRVAQWPQRKRFAPRGCIIAWAARMECAGGFALSVRFQPAGGSGGLLLFLLGRSRACLRWERP